MLPLLPRLAAVLVAGFLSTAITMTAGHAPASVCSTSPPCMSGAADSVKLRRTRGTEETHAASMGGAAQATERARALLAYNQGGMNDAEGGRSGSLSRSHSTAVAAEVSPDLPDGGVKGDSGACLVFDNDDDNRASGGDASVIEWGRLEDDEVADDGGDGGAVSRMELGRLEGLAAGGGGNSDFSSARVPPLWCAGRTDVWMVRQPQPDTQGCSSRGGRSSDCS